MIEQRQRGQGVTTLLLWELALALSLGLWGGWSQTPYDAFILLVALLSCLGVMAAAMLRSVRPATDRRVRLIPRFAPLFLVLSIQPLAWLAIASSSRAGEDWGNTSRFERDRSSYDCVVTEVMKREWLRGQHSFKACGRGVGVVVTDAVRVQLDLTGYFFQLGRRRV